MKTQRGRLRRHPVIPFIIAVSIILFGVSMPAYSQRLILGGKIAGQITNTFTYPALPPIVHEDRVLFGPTAELFLARRLLLEVDTLYKRKVGYTTDFFVGFPREPQAQRTLGTRDVTAHSWDIPIMLKWHWAAYRNNRPFGTLGFSARNVAGITHDYGTVSGGGFPSTSFDTRTSDGAIVNHWTYGPVIGAGVDIHARSFHFQPELRYTRWNDSPFVFFTKPDNVQVLIGIAVEK